MSWLISSPLSSGPCSSGIPSYRGAAGLWTRLRPEMLSATPAQRARIARDPEWVASAELFRENPVPFFEVKREFVLGLARRRWLPTAAHHVVALLHRHGLLSHVLTQNIDGLHQESGVPSDLVTEVHGTTRSARCDGCGRRLALEEYAALAEAHVRDLGGADPGAPARSSDGGPGLTRNHGVVREVATGICSPLSASGGLCGALGTVKNDAGVKSWCRGMGRGPVEVDALRKSRRRGSGNGLSANGGRPERQLPQDLAKLEVGWAGAGSRLQPWRWPYRLVEPSLGPSASPQHTCIIRASPLRGDVRTKKS
ncbi:unnamed protein product [Prorocentrum cordatum]|uniref:Deacetylase sirtuin-type domain-containing protein n=1 Tax=Prorocentrum cordatum TaxID=2364126 RepID=A0ABN9W362_9DINO|nr:unnamed protein product [Polarella glacialis]